jgi:hypothetical protein
MYEFSYLAATLSLGVFWLCFFIIRPDLRPVMLKLSCLFGIGGVASEYVYINDWWSPVTLFGTAVGIEDFLFGFFFSGSVAVCYEVFCNAECQQRKKTPKWPFRFRYIALIICIVFFGSALVLRLHSFIATVLAFGTCIAIIMVYRRDLFGNACFSSLFGGLLSFVFFGFPERLTPGWIESSWALENLSGHFVFYVPLEDFIWFLMAGAFIGPLQKFWKNSRAVPYISQEGIEELQPNEKKPVYENSY